MTIFCIFPVNSIIKKSTSLFFKLHYMYYEEASYKCIDGSVESEYLRAFLSHGANVYR